MKICSVRKRKGPFIVRILPSEIRKPKAVSRSAADFRRDHLFGDRVKRIDCKTPKKSNFQIKYFH